MIWNVLCPGPSLLDASIDGAEGNIGVNLAIRHTCYPQYWCCAEGPKRTHIPKHRPKEGWTISRPNRDGRGKRPPHWVKTVNLPSHPSSLLPWDTDLSLPQRSVFYAICMAIHRGGELIRIFGADMEGDWYVDPSTGERLVGRLESGRWAQERELMGEMVSESSKHGVEVTLR